MVWALLFLGSQHHFTLAFTLAFIHAFFFIQLVFLTTQQRLYKKDITDGMFKEKKKTLVVRSKLICLIAFHVELNRMLGTVVFQNFGLPLYPFSTSFLCASGVIVLIVCLVNHYYLYGRIFLINDNDFVPLPLLLIPISAGPGVSNGEVFC